MGLKELVAKLVEPVKKLPKIEGNTELEDVGPFPFLVTPIEATSHVTNVHIVFDAASLHLQRAAERIGLQPLDIRFRAIVNPWKDPPELIVTSLGTFDKAQRDGYPFQVDFEFECLTAEIDALGCQEDDSSFLLEG